MHEYSIMTLYSLPIGISGLDMLCVGPLTDAFVGRYAGRWVEMNVLKPTVRETTVA